MTTPVVLDTAAADTALVPPFGFTVCSRSGVKRAVKRLGATHILSLLDPGARLYRPHRIDAKNHIQLFFEDDVDPAMLYAPRRHHVEKILEIGRGLRADDRVVVHCDAGVCRSTAAAFLLVAQALGREHAQRAMDLVVQERPQACPNGLVVSHGADILGWPELVDIAEETARRRVERMLRRG